MTATLSQILHGDPTPLPGPAGPQGSQGPTGPQGPAGASGGATLGAIVTTSEILTAPNYLLCDGSAYLQSAYPALYGVVGLMPQSARANPRSWAMNNALNYAEYWAATAYGNGTFVAIGETNKTCRSTDGVTWVASGLLPASTTWCDVIFAQNRFVAVSEVGNCATSADGITWTAAASFATGSGKQRLVQGTNSLVSLCVANLNNRVSRSADSGALAWTTVAITASGFAGTGLTYGNGRFVATGDTNSLISTNEGVTWSYCPNSLPAGAWQSVAFGNGVFVAINVLAAEYCISRDGVTWAKGTMPFGSMGSIFFFAGVFYAFSTLGVATSVDGITWVADTGATIFATPTRLSFGAQKMVAAYGTSPYTTAPYMKLIRYTPTTHFVVPDVPQSNGARAYIKASA